jgi:hypothetical protein
MESAFSHKHMQVQACKVGGALNLRPIRLVAAKRSMLVGAKSVSCTPPAELRMFCRSAGALSACSDAIAMMQKHTTAQCFQGCHLTSTSRHVAFLVLQIVNGPSSYVGGALDLPVQDVTATNVAAKISHATVGTALAVPVILLSFSDTGLIFSLVGAAVSALQGFEKGVGSIK